MYIDLHTMIILYEICHFSSNEDLKTEMLCHDYEFQEPLPSSSEEAFQELWTCIHCKHERVLTHQHR
jgi:hypothetical protein